MPTVTGTISGTGDNFEGRWNVDGRDVLLHGNFDYPVELEEWSANSATLEYESSGDFDGLYLIRPISASHVGGSDLFLSLTDQSDRQIRIVSPLVNPVSERTPVSGKGVWISVP